MNIIRNPPVGGRVYEARSDDGSFGVTRRADMKLTLMNIRAGDTEFSTWLTDEQLAALAARSDDGSFGVTRRADMRLTLMNIRAGDTEFSTWLTDEQLAALATLTGEAAATIHQPAKEAA